MIRYRLNGRLAVLKEGEEYGREDIRIELMTSEEFALDKKQIPYKKLFLKKIEHIQYSKAEIFGGCILGTFPRPMSKISRERKKISDSTW